MTRHFCFWPTSDHLGDLLRTSQLTNDRPSVDLNPALSIVKGCAISATSEVCKPFALEEFQHVEPHKLKVGGRGGVGEGPAAFQRPPRPPPRLTQQTGGPRAPALSFSRAAGVIHLRGIQDTLHTPRPQSSACLVKGTGNSTSKKRGYTRAP